MGRGSHAQALGDGGEPGRATVLLTFLLASSNRNASSAATCPRYSPRKCECVCRSVISRTVEARPSTRAFRGSALPRRAATTRPGAARVGPSTMPPSASSRRRAWGRQADRAVDPCFRAASSSFPPPRLSAVTAVAHSQTAPAGGDPAQTILRLERRNIEVNGNPTILLCAMVAVRRL